MAEPVGLILAAGYSSRMGAFKPLLDFGDAPLLARQIELFRRAGVEDVRVVTGHRAEDLIPLLREWDAREVHNPAYDEGMFSSVRAGVAALAETGKPFFLLPVDYPLIPPFLLELQLSAFRAAGGGVVYSSFENRKGHPPLIGPELIPAILESDGEGGMQAILRRSEKITYVPAWDGRVLMDTDTPEAWAAALALAGQRTVRDGAACEYLYGLLGTGAEVRAHCAAVGRAARLLAEALNGAGRALDAERLYYAGLLHDIKKGTPRHDAAGATLLAAMDYPETAALIAPHMNLPAGEGLSEAALLYYADKITDGATYKSLAMRREEAVRNREKAAHMAARLDAAERVEAEIAAALGTGGLAAAMEAVAHG